ncbi:MAG: ATP-binding protein [Clostridia bacterium]|nr:ATP-binding protein [Clostridia bacterium]
MKTVLGCIRKADADFDLIAPGDRVAVGVSGGKDSLLLLYALSLYRKFSGKDFSLQAITLKMGLEPFDVSPIRALCETIDVPYTVIETEIAKVIFDIRKESNPCALCAKMRRGALNDAAIAAGCNKVALGHHREDAIETLLMSLIFEGRLHTFHPNTYLSRRQIAVIRPMVYLPEKHVIHVVKSLGLPVVHNPCPADGNSKREEMKELLRTLSKAYPQLKEYMLSALQNTAQYGLWDQKQAGRAPAEQEARSPKDA